MTLTFWPHEPPSLYCYKFLQSCINERADSIDVWFNAPGKKLIQDPETSIVHGVVSVVDGKHYNIRAKNGVVLCTGGYENNIQMIQDFLQLPYGYTKGALYNTGDGIKMAMEIGADLWHMGNIAGPDLNAIDESGRAYGYAILEKRLGWLCRRVELHIG